MGGDFQVLMKIENPRKWWWGGGGRGPSEIISVMGA